MSDGARFEEVIRVLVQQAADFIGLDQRLAEEARQQVISEEKYAEWKQKRDALKGAILNVLVVEWPGTLDRVQRRYLKDNAIKLARHHKQYCEGESCTIALYGLLQLLRAAGIEVDKEEFSVFM